MQINKYLRLFDKYQLHFAICIFISLKLMGIEPPSLLRLFISKSPKSLPIENEDVTFKKHKFWSDAGEFTRKKTAADPHEFPWIVHIMILYKLENSKDSGLKKCGGAIINEKWILTAAHCLYPFEMVKDLRVLAGTHNITFIHENVQIRRHKKFIIHETYRIETKLTDIALIELDGSLTLNQFVQVIPIAGAGINSYWKSTDCIVAGWGEISCDILPTILMKANMGVLIYTKDGEMHFSDGVLGEGDSGGPLVCQLVSVDTGESLGPHVLGVATGMSFIDKYLDKKSSRTDVVTSIFHHIPWIQFHARIYDLKSYSRIPKGIEYNRIDWYWDADLEERLHVLIGLGIVMFFSWRVFRYICQHTKRILNAFELFV